MIIGDERAVGRALEQARLHRCPSRAPTGPGQPVYAIAEPPERRATRGLRAATLDDLELLIPVCAAAHEFELGVDPLARDAEGFRWRTRAQIADGRSWLWLDGRRDPVQGRGLRLDADGGADPAGLGRPRRARPRLRSARHARPLPAPARDAHPFVTLFVRTENAPAIALYESIGMRLVGRYRSLLF